MLCLLGVMLSVLCLVSSAPVPTTPVPTTPSVCPNSTLFKETIQVVRKLRSEGRSEIVLQSNMTKAGGNVATYLEGFIQALKNSKESVNLRDVSIVKLQKIQAHGKSCTGWMEHEWEPVEKFDFFKNLDNLLRFLGEKAPDPEKKN